MHFQSGIFELERCACLKRKRSFGRQFLRQATIVGEGRVYAVDDRVVWAAPMRTPAATRFAAIDNVEAIPYLNPIGRKGYEFFLQLPKPRAFVIAPDGGWAYSSKGFDPLAKALQICGRHHQNSRAYAVDDRVVWTEDQPANKQ